MVLKVLEFIAVAMYILPVLFIGVMLVIGDMSNLD